MKTAGNIVAIALACGSLAAAPFLRIGSGPLNASVQNERDAALDRATAWLVAHQSPEGFWGNSNVVATAVAALAIRGDREDLPKAEAEAVEKAVRWLTSSACNKVLSPPVINIDFCYTSDDGREALSRARAWRRLALTVLRPTPREEAVASNPGGYAPGSATFNAVVSTKLALDLAKLLEGPCEGPFETAVEDAAGRFIAAVFSGSSSTEPASCLAGQLAKQWNEGSPGVWLDNPEAAWWLARSINRATGGNLSLPPDANGNVVDVNWRGIMAGRWINSQRIDDAGNGHWDGDAEKTAFAALLLNEM